MLHEKQNHAQCQVGDAALGVINRSVTARAWLTGYYIVEFEQGGQSRAAYGEGLLKRLEQRLSDKTFTFENFQVISVSTFDRVDVQEDQKTEFKRSIFISPETHTPCAKQMHVIAETLAAFMNASRIDVI